MKPEELKAAIDAAIGAKIILSYPQLALFVFITAVVAYFGAYFKKKGENLATSEDVRLLTQKFEDVKITYYKQIEDYKAELARQTRVAEVAEFLTEWSTPKADYAKLNGYSMALSLWLPTDLYRNLAKCVCYSTGAPFPKEVLIDIRKYLLKEDAGDLKAEEIVHFTPPPE
ncbi:MAG: hypothetical protein A2W09_04280 [Deltaproteobacteria bacterium RBG_16_50_11]|nr:MAG: hypothetical protein A2W09_04280 [Deltaproteobacteria bacterium RBG_16_50_11]